MRRPPVQMPPTPSLSQSSGVLTIDLTALADNWRLLAARAAPAQCAAVVKADAYGIGIEAAAPALHAAGCRHFFVAQLSEGTRVRAALAPRPQVAIYVLNGLQAGADPHADYCEHGLAPAIGSEQELARWAAYASTHISAPPCAIHLDTGMNRLGFSSLSALKDAVARHGGPEALGIDLLMSHFVSAEEPDNPLNALQIARFDEAHAAFRDLSASLANSSGVFLRERPAYDLVRPGFALYGGNPTPGAPNPMKPVVSLEIAIQQTRWIEAGDTVGYNQQWTAPRRTRLATLLAGYADGVPRSAGATDRPGAEAVIAGRRCPLVGRMSMDLCVADVTDLPDDSAQPGVGAQLLGDQIGVDEFAARAGASGYHVLTSLGPRYHRRYVG